MTAGNADAKVRPPTGRRLAAAAIAAILALTTGLALAGYGFPGLQALLLQGYMLCR